MKDRLFLERRGGDTRRVRAKDCVFKVWWLSLFSWSRYRCVFARIEGQFFGLASTMYSQRRWSKSDEEECVLSSALKLCQPFFPTDCSFLPTLCNLQPGVLLGVFCWFVCFNEAVLFRRSVGLCCKADW